jgi:hypothetical protein
MEHQNYKDKSKNNNIKKTVDSSLLAVENKLKLNGGTQNIIDYKFVVKPEIGKFQSNFLTPDKFDFLQKFKESTNQLISDVNKMQHANIESKDQTSNNQAQKYVKMNLKLGVLDINQCNNSVSTAITASDNNISNNNDFIPLIKGNKLENIYNKSNNNTFNNLCLNLKEDKESNFNKSNNEFQLSEEDKLNMINNDQLLNLLADEDDDESDCEIIQDEDIQMGNTENKFK